MRRIIIWAAALLLAACVQQKAPASAGYGDGFPMVKAFDLAHAGATVEADFELPEGEDGYLPRPVFIGFRSGGPAGRPDSKPGDWDYLRRQDIPVRVRLWRVEGATRAPVVLDKLQSDLSRASDRHWYEKHPADIFTQHRGAGADGGELLAIGKYRLDWAYGVWEIAKIIPATPGRYHLEVESLQSHPQIDHLAFEVLVSHIHIKTKARKAENTAQGVQQ